MQDNKETIGIIGFGNMGQAIAECIKTKFNIFIFDKDKNKTKGLGEINIADDVVDLVNKSSIVILAVKPQDFDIVLAEIKKHVQGKLIVSIAAGIPASYIEKFLHKPKVIRVMPNLPAKIGEGMICLAKGKYADSPELDFIQSLFDNLGKTLLIEENMMDAATAVSGSGPGFLYDMGEGKSVEDIKNIAPFFITTLTDAAQGLGFAPPIARSLAEATTKGSIAYLEKTKLSPEEARQQVASKGGTTEAGLEVLHRGGSLEEAVYAAKKRAEELSKKE